MMPDPGQLPPSVYQGLGWPQPDGSPIPMQPPGALGPPAEWGGLPPSIPQGLGWAPPPAPGPDDAGPPVPPSAPTSLPSMPAPPTAQPARSATPDYQVPASTFGGGQPAAGAPPARPAAPARPQTFDQRMTGLEKRQDEAAAQEQQGIQAGLAAEHVKNVQDKAAFQQYDQQAQANADARKAENEQWAKIYATNEAKMDADRKQIESWKFNRNKFMDDLGVGGEVSYGIGAILAGFGNALQGIKGPNPVIEQLQQNIHDANEQQMKERDNLVQRLGMDRQTGLDAQAYHATRQAEVDKQDGLALTALSKKLEESAVTAADPMAQSRAITASAQVKEKANALLQSSIQLSSQHEMETKKIGIAGGELALNRQKFDWEKNKEQQQLDINAAKLLATKQGKLDEEQQKRAITVPGPDGKMMIARQADGSPVLAGTAELADTYQKQINATRLYSSLADRMMRGLKDHGGESGWLKSADWQKMQSDYASAIATLHTGYGIESYRGEFILDMMKQLATAKIDPTSFIHDVTPALQESKANLQERTNGLVEGKGFSGEIHWADNSNPPVPTQTDEERMVSDGLRNPISLLKDKPGKFNMEFGPPLVSEGPGASLMADAQARQAQVAKAGGIMPSVKQAMVTWGAALQSPDLAIRRHYYQQLEKIAQESESPETAAFAQKLLDTAQAQQINAAPGASEPTRGSAGAPR